MRDCERETRPDAGRRQGLQPRHKSVRHLGPRPLRDPWEPRELLLLARLGAFGPRDQRELRGGPKEITFWTDRDGNKVATPHVVAIAAGDTSSFAFTREATFAWGKTHQATPGVDMGQWTDEDERLPDSTLGLGVLAEHLFYPRQTDLPRR